MFPTGFFILVKHPNGKIIAVKSDPTATCVTLDYFMRIANTIADATA